jgi:hypothetical protein
VCGATGRKNKILNGFFILIDVKRLRFFNNLNFDQQSFSYPYRNKGSVRHVFHHVAIKIRQQIFRPPA